MVELKGEKVVLRTLEREHCRQLWERYEPVEPVPTKALNAGLSVEGADKWFDEMQARQGHEHVYLGVFTPWLIGARVTAPTPHAPSCATAFGNWGCTGSRGRRPSSTRRFAKIHPPPAPPWEGGENVYEFIRGCP